MNLYRKTRPNIFADVVSNEGNIQQLQQFVKDEKRPHTYLFTGSSGCGKTTLARIFANELGADELSIQEMNMADSRGIDTMRDLIEKMRYKPAIGQSVVYILDEFHMATREAQSAMLKPFEDTPAHVYFMLCTTDPQKIIKTIKTRCTQIEVDTVDFKKLFRYLKKIAEQESIEVSNTVIKHIAKESDSIRQALVQLEQCIGIEDEEVQLKIIKNVSEDNVDIRELCQALLKRNWHSCVKILKQLREQKLDSEKIRYAVLGYMTSVVLNSGDSVAVNCLDYFGEHTYESKFAGIVYACYEVIQGE